MATPDSGTRDECEQKREIKLPYVELCTTDAPLMPFVTMEKQRRDSDHSKLLYLDNVIKNKDKAKTFHGQDDSKFFFLFKYPINSLANR